MKAVVYHKYGSPDILHLQEVEKPTPKENEVLVKIHAASLNALDWHLLTADIFLVRLMGMGMLKPKHKTLGADIAGWVEAVGSNVRRLQPGDEVFGDISQSGLGGFAEYTCAHEDQLVLKPKGITFEEAAAIPVAAVTALQGLRDKGKIQTGQKVLIHGASGGVGTFAVQIAKAFGAEVTAVCSTRNLDMVHSLGAHHIIDYTKEDFTKNGKRYDLILAVNGNRSIFEFKRAMNPGGIFVCAGGTLKTMFQTMLLGPWISMAGSKKMGMVSAKVTGEDLEFLKELLDAGKVKPVIDKKYPLDEIVEAFRYMGKGHAQGKIVITMEQNT